MQVNGYRHFESQRHIRKPNPVAPDEYKFLWSETFGLRKKLNIIYNFITCNTSDGLEWCLLHGLIILLMRFIILFKGMCTDNKKKKYIYF